MDGRRIIIFGALFSMAALAACGGGGGGSSTPPPATGGGGPPKSTNQVVRIALPTSQMGYNSSAFGAIGGYTQESTSQVLGFTPGQQVMLENAQATGAGSPPHTLGDVGSQSFPPGQPGALSFNNVGGKTLSAGFQSGTLNPGQQFGPMTLTTGTYYIGCAYHYSEFGMRDVIVVSAGAAPGPEATSPPGQGTPPPQGGGYGY